MDKISLNTFNVIMPKWATELLLGKELEKHEFLEDENDFLLR